MAQRSPLSPRKQPRQRRAQETVDAILEAAARVFAERGHAAGTTNHIAAAAGVSVGSLYEYFPNKDAILVALVERQLDAMMAQLHAHLEETRRSARDLEGTLQGFVATMLAAHEKEPDLYRISFSEAPHPPELHACVLKMEESLAHALEQVLLGLDDITFSDSSSDSDTAAHLVVQTTEALTHRFVHHGIHGLPRDRFIREVVTLLLAYLRATEARGSTA